jgi:hypothetical protein
MGKHLLVKADIAKLNKLAESEVTEWTSSTFNETYMTILMLQGNRGITIVCSQSQITLGMQVILY